MELQKLISPNKKHSHLDTKAMVIGILNEMTEGEVNQLLEELKQLAAFKSSTEGKWMFPKDKEPRTLLTRFWQRSSDACPLEAGEAEKQENEFNDWTLGQYEEAMS